MEHISIQHALSFIKQYSKWVALLCAIRYITHPDQCKNVIICPFIKFEVFKKKKCVGYRCNFVPFFLQTSLKVCIGTGCSFSIGDKSGMQAGQSGTRTHFFLSHACNVCRMSFIFVLLLKICMGVPGKDVVLKAAYVAPKSLCTL